MRVIAGPEKKSRVMSEKERLVTAYHELGHAIVGHLLEHSDPVHKVSIISRGQALGYTISLPTEDKFLTTRAELNDTMAMTLGGRAAEEIVFERDHHRRLQRPREGDRDREADGDALRHVRAPRAPRLRPRPRPALPRPRVLRRARLLRRGRPRDRRRDPPHRRGGPPDRARASSPTTASSSTGSRRSCSSARRSRPSSSSPCSRASPRTRSSRPTRRRRRRGARGRGREEGRPRGRRARACSRSPASPAAAPPRCAATVSRNYPADLRGIAGLRSARSLLFSCPLSVG